MSNVNGATVTLSVSPELVDAVAQRMAELMKEKSPTGFLNVKNASMYLDVTEDALRARVKRREIPVHRRDGRLYFDRRELDAYVRGEA